MKNKRKHFELYRLRKPAEVFSMPSARMIKTLKEFYQMEIEHPGKPYGPADFEEPLIGLYKRGLLDFYPNKENKAKPGTWHVTKKVFSF